jgi:hypothetical protein
MSSKVPMPFDDDKMSFYAFGTNLAIQISGSVNLSQLLDK